MLLCTHYYSVISYVVLIFDYKFNRNSFFSGGVSIKFWVWWVIKVNRKWFILFQPEKNKFQIKAKIWHSKRSQWLVLWLVFVPHCSKLYCWNEMASLGHHQLESRLLSSQTTSIIGVLGIVCLFVHPKRWYARAFFAARYNLFWEWLWNTVLHKNYTGHNLSFRLINFWETILHIYTEV